MDISRLLTAGLASAELDAALELMNDHLASVSAPITASCLHDEARGDSVMTDSRPQLVRTSQSHNIDEQLAACEGAAGAIAVQQVKLHTVAQGYGW